MASSRNPDFAELSARLTHALRGAGLPFMVIGGQAVLVHGEPRLTHDIDVTVAVGPDRLELVIDACRAAGLDPLPADPQQFVRETYVLPTVDPASGVRIDVIFSTTPYEAQAIERAVRVEVAGASVPFGSAEDLILHKLLAGRPRDAEDAAGVVRRQGDRLDWEYLRRWAREFAAVPGRESLPTQIDDLQQTSRS